MAAICSTCSRLVSRQSFMGGLRPAVQPVTLLNTINFDGKGYPIPTMENIPWLVQEILLCNV